MGDFIPKFNEGDAKQSLIRSQLAEEKLVGDVLIAFGTPIVSIGIMGAGEPARLFDNNTLFQAASILKATTALAAIKLCQEGKLDLDAPISQYLSLE
jgi:hypothetical protein